MQSCRAGNRVYIDNVTYLLKGSGEIGVHSARVQQDARHGLLAPPELDAHRLRQLVQRRLAGAVGVPAPDAVVLYAAHAR